MNYNQVMELPCDLFQLMLKNQFIDKLNETEEGREYLAKCERLQQTEVDIEKLHKKYKK